MQYRLSLLSPVLLLVLLSCVAPVKDSAVFRTNVESFIRTHISELSPEPAVLGGTFYVTAITWIDDDTAQVEYEDGHIALRAEADVHLVGEDVVVDRFEITEDYGAGLDAS